MKHSLAPKHLPTAKILASVESAIYRENLSAEAKETVRAKVASNLKLPIFFSNNRYSLGPQ